MLSTASGYISITDIIVSKLELNGMTINIKGDIPHYEIFGLCIIYIAYCVIQLVKKAKQGKD